MRVSNPDGWRSLLSEYQTALGAFDAAAGTLVERFQSGVEPTAQEVQIEEAARAGLSFARKNLWTAWRVI